MEPGVKTVRKRIRQRGRARVVLSKKQLEIARNRHIHPRSKRP